MLKTFTEKNLRGPWWYPYYHHWRTISEEEAANIAQELAVRHVKRLGGQGLGLTSVTNWLLIQTNRRPLYWDVKLIVDADKSEKEVYMTVTNGPSGWAARLR